MLDLPLDGLKIFNKEVKNMNKMMIAMAVVLILTFSLASVSFAIDQKTIQQTQNLKAVSSSREYCTKKICDATVEAVKALQKAEGFSVASLSELKTCKAIAEALRQREKEISGAAPAK